MAERSLHIAWIGFAPGQETGGVPGIAADLLQGLSERGHRIDCFFPAREHELVPRVAAARNLTFVWGSSAWSWNRWYSRTRVMAFASSQIARAVASLRLRREVVRRHREDPYDLFYQFSNVENLAMPRSLGHEVPLVVHPGQSSADALRFLLRERRLHRRGRPTYAFAVAAALLWSRRRVQRRSVRRARLVICISDIFREHLARDYGLSPESSVVIPNPVRVDRFDCDLYRPLRTPPRIVVLGRIATGKGLEDVVALARLLLEREVDVEIRVVGGTSMWSDYTKLLDDLPAENSRYVGFLHGSKVPRELGESDILLQASKYEAFALTVGEALAAGTPVVATTEVGAIEFLDSSVAAAVHPGDIEGMADAVAATLAKLRANPGATRSAARAQAERAFAPEIVCAQISDALERLAAGGKRQVAVNHPADRRGDELDRSSA